MSGLPRGDDASVFSVRPPFGVRRITVSPLEESREESICLPLDLLA